MYIYILTMNHTATIMPIISIMLLIFSNINTINANGNAQNNIAKYINKNIKNIIGIVSFFRNKDINITKINILITSGVVSNKINNKSIY